LIANLFLMALCVPNVNGKVMSPTTAYRSEDDLDPPQERQLKSRKRGAPRPTSSERQRQRDADEAARKAKNEAEKRKRDADDAARKAEREAKKLARQQAEEAAAALRNQKQHERFCERIAKQARDDEEAEARGKRGRGSFGRSRSSKRLDHTFRRHDRIFTHAPCPTEAPTATDVPVATPDPTSTTATPTTLAPTVTTQECAENPKDVAINVDVQIQYDGDAVVDCDSDAQDELISTNIQAVLNEQFGTRIPDWKGVAAFGEFIFDGNQAVDNLKEADAVVRRNLRRSRNLQDAAACPTRNVDCSSDVADLCRWGCVTATTTDCGEPASTTDSWPNLADDIQVRLASLGFACLGTPAELKIIVNVA